MLAGLRSLWAVSPIAGAEDLSRFIDRHSAFVSQKCTVEYCRARAGLHWVKLFDEPVFLEALNRCRRHAYTVVLIRMVVAVEAKLRPALGASGSPASLAAALADAARRAHCADLSAEGDSAGWTLPEADLRRALAEAQSAPVQPAYLIGRAAAGPVHELLPIHPTLRRHDRELIANNLSLNFCRTIADFERRVRPTPLLADLCAADDGRCSASQAILQQHVSAER